MEDKKPWFLSRTILVNVFAGLAMIVSVFSPSVGSFLSENFSAVGGAWAIINVILRMVTSKQIS